MSTVSYKKSLIKVSKVHKNGFTLIKCLIVFNIYNSLSLSKTKFLLSKQISATAEKFTSDYWKTNALDKSFMLK